jgi:hypothetical protein
MKPADITLSQLGGRGRLTAMIGAKDFFCSSDEQTLMFKFKLCKKANYCEITINDRDEYDLVFKKIHRAPSLKQLMAGKEHKMPTVVEVFNSIQSENLHETFQDFTGLDLSL